MPRSPSANTDGLYAPRRSRPSKLTPQQRDEIRQRLADGGMPKPLALEYGVSAGTIRTYR